MLRKLKGIIHGSALAGGLRKDTNFSKGLEDPSLLSPRQTKLLGLLGTNPVAAAHDAVHGLLAVASDAGDVLVVGAGGVSVRLPPPVSLKNQNPNKAAPLFLRFHHYLHTNTSETNSNNANAEDKVLLVTIDDHAQVSVWNLSESNKESSQIGDDAPFKVVMSITLPAKPTSAELPAGQKWLYIGLDDGAVVLLDVTTSTSTAKLSHYRVPCLLESASASSTTASTSSNRAVVCLQSHPDDYNKMLIGYEDGSIFLWNFRLQKVLKKFKYSYTITVQKPLPATQAPQVPSKESNVSSSSTSASASPAVSPAPNNVPATTAAVETTATSIQTISPRLTCLHFHPLGRAFVSGYADGRFAFWDLRQDVPRSVHDIANGGGEGLDAAMIKSQQQQQQQQHATKKSSTTAAGKRTSITRMLWSCRTPGNSGGGPSSASDEPYAFCNSMLIVSGGTVVGESNSVTIFEYRHPRYSFVHSESARDSGADYGVGDLRRTQRLRFDGEVVQTLLIAPHPWFNSSVDPHILLCLTASISKNANRLHRSTSILTTASTASSSSTSGATTTTSGAPTVRTNSNEQNASISTCNIHAFRLDQGYAGSYSQMRLPSALLLFATEIIGSVLLNHVDGDAVHGLRELMKQNTHDANGALMMINAWNGEGTTQTNYGVQWNGASAEDKIVWDLGDLVHPSGRVKSPLIDASVPADESSDALLITWHRDRIVRVWDLAGDEVEILRTLIIPHISPLLSPSESAKSKCDIVGVEVDAKTLQLVVMLSTGSVIVYSFGCKSRAAPPPQPVQQKQSVPQSGSQQEHQQEQQQHQQQQQQQQHQQASTPMISADKPTAANTINQMIETARVGPDAAAIAATASATASATSGTSTTGATSAVITSAPATTATYEMKAEALAPSPSPAVSAATNATSIANIAKEHPLPNVPTPAKHVDAEETPSLLTQDAAAASNPSASVPKVAKSGNTSPTRTSIEVTESSSIDQSALQASLAEAMEESGTRAVSS